MARTWCGAVTLLTLASLIGCKSETTEPPIQSTLLGKKETKQDKPTTTTSIDKKKDEPVAKAKDKKQLVPGVDLSPEEEQFIALVHAARDNAKLQRLNPHPALFRAAKAHAAEMAKNKALDDDVDVTGYEYQNISQAVGSSSQLNVGNLLGAGEQDAGFEFQDFGFGVFHDAASGKIYWVRIFAKPK